MAIEIFVSYFYHCVSSMSEDNHLVLTGNNPDDLSTLVKLWSLSSSLIIYFDLDHHHHHQDHHLHLDHHDHLGHLLNISFL